VSGYIADDSNWTALSDDWDVLLKKHRIPYLHVADFIASEGIYKKLGWQDKAKKCLVPCVLDDFIDVVCRHTILGIGIGMDAKKYREITKDVKKRAKPEVFCFERIIGGALAILDVWKWEEPICMVFDDSEAYSMKAYANLCEVKKRRPEIKDRIGLIGFGNDEILPPLQAADLLAYATQKLQGLGGQEAWLRHPQFSKLLQSSTPGYGKMYCSEFWSADFLEESRENIIAIGNGKPFIR
jgi:hypothetical protein